MEKKYEITKELRETSVDFLNTFANYRKCLDNLNNEEKKEFTEEEVNEILNLLGSFRLREVYSIVDRFKIEVTQLKSIPSEQPESTAEKEG